MTTITVWADIRCPWCWMGHRRLEAAVERAERKVAVVRRSFLLEPAGPGSPDQTVRGAALNSWGMSKVEWEATRLRVATAGREDGLEIDMAGVRSSDSRPAHRLIKLAINHGSKPDHVWERLFAAHLGHHEDLEAPETLRRIGAELGLDEAEVDTLLSSDAFTAEVDADHRAAVEHGVSSIPTFVYEGRALSGARNTDELVAFLSVTETVR